MSTLLANSNDWFIIVIYITAVICGISILFSFITSILSVLAYANVIGFKRSTHKLIMQPWTDVNKEAENITEYVNNESDEDIETGNIQDFPTKKKGMTIKEQMAEYVYPDEAKEHL